MPVRQHIIERSGRGDLEGPESAYQRAIDGVSGDLRELEGLARDAAAFGGSGSVWASPTPTTTQDAITRLAAAVSSLLGAPIP